MIRDEKEHPIPRLLQPLTEDGLRNLMRERAYWDLKHPSSPLYQRLVAQGFAFLFPGKTKYDETGKAIDVQPLPPKAVAHQVAQVNREMDRLERSLNRSSFVARDPRDDGNRQPFDERPTGTREGAVHVQAHTRDGGETEVIDYWRARPGQGNGDDARGGTNDDEDRPEPMTSRDAEDAEGVQAGTDNPKPWEGRHNAELREAIAGYEQSTDKKNDGYEERHPDGALGRYQMTRTALDDIKWRNRDGTWTEEARKHGVASDADFLENPQAQETAMDKLLDRYEEQADKKRLFDRVGQTFEGREGKIEVTKAGVMAAVHHGGATGTVRYFEKIDQADDVSNDAPLNEMQTAIETRMRKSQGIDYQRKQDR